MGDRKFAGAERAAAEAAGAERAAAEAASSSSTKIMSINPGKAFAGRMLTDDDVADTVAICCCKEGTVSSAQLECVSTSARKTGRDDPKPIDAIRIRALRYHANPTTPHEKVLDGLRGTHHTNEVPRRAPWDPSH